MPLRLRTAAVAVLCLPVALAALAAGAPAQAAAACATTLWTAGSGGYNTYRIPAVVAVGGTLVAFAEARRNSPSDSGDIAVVERRSADGGCTWSAQRVVADDGQATVGNPVPLVTDAGALVLVTNRQAGKVTQAQIQSGAAGAQDGRRVFVQTSRDAGATWTARREITASVKRSAWRWYATGPGHGLTLRRGPDAGRLVVAADHTTAGPRGVHLLISDDDGLTWRIGASDDHSDGVVKPDETSAAELPDGRIYLSAREQGGTAPGNRAYTYSPDSGESFAGPFRALPAFPTPTVEGSVLQDPAYLTGAACAPLLYSGPQDPAARKHMTVRRSDDAGLTWHTIAELNGPTAPAAYSDLVMTARTTVGVLYETGGTTPYQRIDFRKVRTGCA